MAQILLTDAKLQEIKVAFEGRIHSLEVDLEKCLSTSTPGIAFFPAVLYAFATLDFFSSYWAGWNEGRKDRNQTDRMVSFSERFLSYKRKEAQIAVNIWRHKLMHTSEPRVVENADTGERYVWSIGPDTAEHMKLNATGTPNEFRIHFAPLMFCKELKAAVLGPDGYFAKFSTSSALQQKWCSCQNEFNSYKIKLKP